MTARKPIIFVLLAFATAYIIQCKPSQNQELMPQIDSYFEKYVFNKDGDGSNNTPGVSILITKNDEVLFAGQYGTADLTNKTPISESTIFDLASLTKQFTGMAIAILEENGKISESDKISKYIPDLPGLMQDITISQLVHHTSGIRDWPILFGLKGWQPEESLSLDQIYELLKNQENLNFNPGSAFSYSNSNYNLLVKIIEAVTDTTFNIWMRDSIFIPLGMHNTFFIEDGKKMVGDIATSYVHSGQDYIQFKDKLNAPGSSSLRSNSRDMSKWMINFYNKRVLGENVYDRITRKGKLNNNTFVDYGYGLHITELCNKKAYYHDGVWGGYRNVTVFLPEDNIGIVLLSNDGLMQAKKTITDIVNIVIGKAEKKEVNDQANELNEKEINDEFFALCEGKYEQVVDKGCFWTFYKDGDEYFVNAYNKNLKLYARSDSVFYIKEAKAEFVFHLENGEVNSHSLKQNGKSYLAIKVKEKKEEEVIGFNYNDLIGAYYSDELDIEYEIIYENQELKIQLPFFPEAIILNHSHDLVFNSNMGLIQSISFIKDYNGISGFNIDNSRAKNLLFNKIDL